MLELILSKKSSESEIKSYFNAVLELSKSDNEFPINLDEVWMLVYGRKEEAVRALTSSEQFIENIDYQVLRKNAEWPSKKYCFRLVVWKVCVTLYRSQMTIAFVTLSKRLSCSYHTWVFLCPYWILAVAFT